MTQTPLEQYRSTTYDLTVAKLKQEQEAKKTPLQELLTKSANQPTQK
jgi:hypothetical protein